MNRFDGIYVFTSGVDFAYLGSGIAIIMNIFLAHHVYKVSEMPDQIFCVRLFFKNKLSVSILGLYAGVSSVVWFSQAGDINSLITKTVNKSSFVVLSGDFNENNSRKCASFKKCFDLGLVNSLVESAFAKVPTWCNSCGIAKMIDYVFVSSNLANVMVDHNMASVVDYFDTDHAAVSVSVSLGGLLNVWQTRIIGNITSKILMRGNAYAAMFSCVFKMAKKSLDLDAIWNIVCGVVVSLANGTFKRKWFKDYDSVFTKMSSKFHKLELLVSRLVKASYLVSSNDFVLLLNTWDRLNFSGTAKVKSLFLSGSTFDVICSKLAKTQKFYHSSKLLESKHAKESCIRQAITSRIESFELDKNRTIRSVLEYPFCKMILDHLVVDDELVLEPNLVKSKVNKIMKGWMRKYRVVFNISGDWTCQYQPLDYVFDGAFSGVMDLIGFDKLFVVVSDLPDDKAVGLSGISNELWKHCDSSVLAMLSVLLNLYLIRESKDVFTNTHPIALIKTAYKILFKILLDRISLACSTYNGTTMQSPIFAIGFVIEDALKKNCELWLVLQDMHKAYNSVGWKHLRRSLLGWVESQIELTSFFAADAFIDDTIWVGSSQAATQHILNVASEFFRFNDISINNNKTVAISINCQVSNPYLTVSGSPISIAKKKEFHCYLGIFLSSESLSKPSIAKTHLDVRFFVNLILRKAISDKQFAYLGGIPMSLVLGEPGYFKYVSSLRWYEITFVNQLHDKHDNIFVHFLSGVTSSSDCFLPLDVSSNIL
ncbi:hypothetical protein G9A89_013651 [Geosiphon pyriformis]|nr:hypothetical protein G9A89_013651 [Geosiphon pyriformis]